ncbi:ABC transporter permease [Desulfogranum mediterraneum]|uniref:ABC transporter permease n=1 Tax=Desulfogranum mediterraneum TaxID=160661 RepID=UPI0004182A40|nr:FtsX-like permease family protein [Desulfogranum mediterraneum]
MNALNRKLVRDIRHNLVLLLAVSAIIAVGIGCFVGMLSTARNLEYARSSYYSSCRLADFWLDLKKAPVQEVRRLAAIPGISEIRERIQFQVMLDLPGAEKPIGATLLSLPDQPAPVINNIILRQGTYFSPGRANEVIVSDKFAQARRIRPGDTIMAVLNNRRRELVVTGTAISAEFVYLASPGSMVDEPGSYGLLFIKRSFAEDSFGFHSGCNSVVGLLAPGARAESKVMVEALAARLKPHGVFSGIPRQEQFSPMVLDGEMKQLLNTAVIFPLFFLIVAALVLNVLMIRLAEQQRTVIGTLKAIGYDNRELMHHFLRFAAVTGLVGGLLGCLFGYLLGDAMTRMYVRYFTFPQLTSQLYPDLQLTGIAIALLFAILGTIRGVRRIMALEPAEAMRQAPPPLGGAVFLERFQGWWTGLDAQWQMILRGLLRNKGRTAIAMFSAALGSSIVVLAFGFVDSMDQMVRLQFERVLRSDYHLSFHDELSSSGLDAVRRLPGVNRAEPVLNLACTFRRNNRLKRGVIMAIHRGSSLTTPVDDQGRPIGLPATGLLMTTRLMEQLQLRPGELVEVVPVKGEQLSRRLPVIQSMESMLGLVVYADFHWLNRVLGTEGVLNEVRILASHTPAQRQGFMTAIRAMPGLESLTDLGEQRQALNKQLNGAMRFSAVIMILLAGVIFFGAILNSTLIAIAERQREMATFRAMGYFSHEVARIFLRENLVNNLSGTLAGLPLGYWLLKASMQAFSTDAYSFPAHLAPMSPLYTLGLAFLFVLLSQIVVIRTLGRQNWLEALSLKE